MAKKTCQNFLKFSRGFPEPHDNLLAKMVCQPNWFWLQNFHGFCQPKWFLATKFSRGFPEPHDDLLAKMVCQPNWFWLQNFHGFCQPKWFLATGFASQNGFWLQNFHGFCQPKWFLATKCSRVLPAKMGFGYELFTGLLAQKGFGYKTSQVGQPSKKQKRQETIP